MRKKGFTLIELSVVLVIIGLIIGGVMVGQDLIESANSRASAKQLEGYNSAIYAFKIKYGQMPGDMDGTTAAAIGFVARAGTDGRGDNNGRIVSYCYCGISGILGNYTYPWGQSGEALFFWEDLSLAEMIGGVFNTATDGSLGGGVSSNFGRYFPISRIGNNNYVSVFSGGIYSGGVFSDRAGNYFSVSVPVSIGGSGNYTSTAGMTVLQAYNLDAKIDDGIPNKGRIQAFYNRGGGSPILYAPNAAVDDSTTCFNTTRNVYSTAIDGGKNINCGLSFRMQ